MFNNFKYLVREGLRNAWSNRLMTLASVGVLVCCLVLMGSAVVISVNISAAMKWLQGQNVIMVYLNDVVSGSDAVSYTPGEVKNKIMSIDNIATAEYISKEDGYEKLLDRFEEKPELVTALGKDGNILPNAFKVTLKDQSRYETTIQQLQNLDVVYKVRENTEYADKLNGINKTVMVVGIWIVGLLLVVSLFIITNTVKLTMFVRKLEISIMKSVGATDWFIRMPFLVEGVVIGLAAGIISFGLVSYIYSAATSALTKIVTTGALAYGKIAPWLLLAFLGCGILSGAFGSFVSIRKYLKDDGGVSGE